MAYQPLEELLPRAGWGVYRLVRLASKRALELSETGAALIKAPSEQKLATTALEEILAGKVMDQQSPHKIQKTPKTTLTRLGDFTIRTFSWTWRLFPFSRRTLDP